MIQEQREIAKIVVLIGFLAFVLANVIYDYTTAFDSLYYKAQAFAFTCYAWGLSRFIGWTGRMVFWVCLAQLFDEFFGNPLEPNIWEWIGLVGFFIYEFLKYKKCLKWL